MCMFDFEYVNQDQLRDVIERVERDKRRRRENAEWTAYLLRTKEKSCPRTEIFNNNLLEKELSDPYISDGLPLEVVKRQKFVNRQENVKHSQKEIPRYDVHVPEAKDTGEIRFLIQKIRSLRHNISRSLDSILVQNERKILKENLFKGTPKKLEETESKRKLMNYHCRILRLDYQLVMDMRKLSKNTVGDDMILLLKFLSKCHTTTSKLLQVFANAWCDILEMDENGEKFCDLLKTVITLTRYCKIIRFSIGEVVEKDDLIIDVINKRCKDILHAMKNRPGMEFSEENGIHVEEVIKLSKDRDSCKKHQSFKSKNLELKNQDKDSVFIPMKRFKKIAKQYFGAQERSGKHSEKSVPGSYKDGNTRRLNESSTKKREKAVEKKKAQHTICNTSKKKSMKPDIKCTEKSKPDSLGIQDIPSLESEIKNFDVESFSKKLYTALEKEIHNNIKCIFRNISGSQLQIYQNGGQRSERQIFYHENHLDLLQKLKESFHVAELEDIPLENENGRSLQGNIEVEELSNENLKQNEELLKLTNEKNESMESNRDQTKKRLNRALQITAASHISEHDIHKPHETIIEKLSSSDGSSLVDKENVFAALLENGAGPVVKPWDVIGSISERLIAECLGSISNELDNYIVQNIFDLEFH